MMRNVNCLSIMQSLLIRALVMLIVLFVAACGSDEPENMGSVTTEESAQREAATTSSPQPAVVELP